MINKGLNGFIFPVLGCFIVLLQTSAVYGEICGSINETDGVLQTEENPCRAIQGARGEIINMVPRVVRLFPFPSADTKHFVCQLPENTILPPATNVSETTSPQSITNTGQGRTTSHLVTTITATITNPISAITDNNTAISANINPISETTDNSTRPTISATTSAPILDTTDTNTTISATTSTPISATIDNNTTISTTTNSPISTPTDNSTIFSVATSKPISTTTDNNTTFSAATGEPISTTADNSTTILATTSTPGLPTTDSAVVSQIVCEWQRSLIECVSGVIHIRNATYGRTDTTTCSHLGYTSNTDCIHDVYSVLSQCCDGSPRCTLYAHNDIFVDPCPDVPVSKYVSVSYTCEDVSLNLETGPSFIVCEGFSDVIDCGTDVIIISSANYGRTDMTICPYCYSSVPMESVCESTNTENILSFCNGQNSCSVNATSEVFGDPCPHTYKYLEVTYKCK